MTRTEAAQPATIASRLRSERLAAHPPAELAVLLQATFFAALLGSAELWAEVDLTMPQLKVLLLLAEFGSVPVSWLAGRMSVSPPNITGILDRLESHGLTARAMDPRDRRVVRVALVPAGGQLLWSMCAVGGAKLADGAASLPSDEQRALRATISSLLQTMESPA